METDTKLAPIIAFMDDCDDLHYDDDKEPLVENQIVSQPPTPQPLAKKTMVDRSCMTSREPSNLENHLNVLNNFEISFQG